LKLTLEEQGVLTTCEINTIEDGEDSFELAALATAFRRTNEVRGPNDSSLSIDCPPHPPKHPHPVEFATNDL
jgi:hypothetical protein